MFKDYFTFPTFALASAMGMTIVMREGHMLHVQDATAAQVRDLRIKLEAGCGSFKFTTGNRVYIINCGNVMYIDMTPASAIGV